MMRCASLHTHLCLPFSGKLKSITYQHQSLSEGTFRQQPTLYIYGGVSYIYIYPFSLIIPNTKRAPCQIVKPRVVFIIGAYLIFGEKLAPNILNYRN